MHLNIEKSMKGIMLVEKETGKLVYKDANDLTYVEKKEVYNTLFSYGFFDKSIDPKLILLSLTSTVVMATKKKNPKADTLDIIKKLVDYDPTKIMASTDLSFLETVAIMTDEFLYGAEVGNTFGLKTIPEIKAKVKELVDNRYPF